MMKWSMWRKMWLRTILSVPIVAVVLATTAHGQVTFRVVSESASTKVIGGGAHSDDFEHWQAPVSENDQDINASNFAVAEVTWQAVDAPVFWIEGCDVEDPVANSLVHVIAEGKTAGVVNEILSSPRVYIKCQDLQWILNDCLISLSCSGGFWSVAETEVAFEDDADEPGFIIYNLHVQLDVSGGSQAGGPEREFPDEASVYSQAGSCLIEATYSAANDEWSVHIEVPSLEWGEDDEGNPIVIGESIDEIDKVVAGKNLSEYVVGQSPSFVNRGRPPVVPPTNGTISTGTNFLWGPYILQWSDEGSYGASYTGVDAAAWVTASSIEL